MGNANLYCAFRKAFPKDLNAPFLTREGGEALSYASLDQGVAKVATCLRMLGVLPGDRVLVQVNKSVEAVLLYLGTLRAGAVFVPLNTAYTAAEVAYFAGDAAPRVMVVAPERIEEMALVAEGAGAEHLLALSHGGSGSLMDRVAQCEPDDAVVERASDDLAAILYTSGTTGRSKGAMLTHANLETNARSLVDLWGFGEADILIHALPIYHVHGLFVALHCVLLSGASTHFLPKFDAAAILTLIPNSTVLMGVPTFYTRLLESAELSPAVCRDMRLFISGSAPLLVDTFEAFEARSGHKILERYGMTEAGMITSNPLKGERVQGTVGMPLPGVDARVIAEDGSECAAGEVGTLQIKGENVFTGYWQMPEKTAQEFTEDGYFITGDLATMAEDGRVSIVGRGKDLVISGGFNIYPKEIELLVDDVEGVKESAIVGVPHPDFGEGVVAVVVRDGDVTADEIMTNLSDKVARFKQPKHIVFVDALPRNAMGKVQKNVLRDEHQSAFGGA